MGRSLVLVVAAVALIAGIALVDERREIAAADTVLAGAPAEPSPAEPPDEAFGDTDYLLSCLGSDLVLPDSVPPAPALDPQGVEEVADRMERVRGLRFDGPVDVAFLDDEQLDQRIDELIDRGTPPPLVAKQDAVLELLGAIPPDADLEELTRAALSEQVLGLFVPETEELLVASEGEGGALEQITLAHELEHALAYDALGFPVGTRPTPGEGDRDLAAHALIEGDATLAMELYALRFVDIDEQLELLDEPGVASGGELDRLPHFLQQQLLFPYEAGLRYVCSRYEDGGWEAVDRAYADPPQSTAELLDPAAGPIAPAEPPALGDLPAPWRRTLSDQVGAAELSWLFEAPGDDPEAALPDPAEAAADWRGGAFALWQDGRREAVGLSIAAAPDAELCGALIAWYGAARPAAVLAADGEATTFSEPGRAAAVLCDEAGVRVGIGPDAETAAALTG
jgi:hypothetical protein